MSSISPPTSPPIPTPSPQSLPPAASSVIESPALPSNPSMASPPPKSSPPPEPTPSPPPSSPNIPPPSLTPPPQPSNPPPISSPPPVSPPPPSPTNPRNSPPPPSPTNPRNSPPPPSTNQPPPPSPTPVSSPPPPSSSSTPPPPTMKPPSPPAQPPQSSPPPIPEPPESSPPPPLPKPPDSSPPPPQPKPPESSPPPPSSSLPQNSPPPPPPSNPGTTPVPPRSEPTSPPPSISSPLSPPPPAIQTSPPSLLPPSPPSPSIVSPATPSTNSSSDSAPRNSQSSGGGGLGTGPIVAIVVILGLLFLGILGAAACCLKKRKKSSGHNGGYIMPTSSGSYQEADSASLNLQMSAPNNGSGSGTKVVHSPHEPGGFGHSKTWFNYQELVEATNGFSAQNLLGEGGFGSVYKGNLADGGVVAVKQLRIGGGQGEREFRAEVEIISRIHHRHLVSLVGYCINENSRLLVYDYVSNNNLYFHLHDENKTVLDWGMRAKIALGAARGIAYLHEDCHPRIIHRDIKSSNILLDNNFEARVSDFGLAKIAVEANTHITTRVMGTFGYMAPEYASTGKLTERSDVYSFGVVLLELITGRKPVNASQDESLVEWARPRLSQALETNEFGELADPILNSQYVDSEMYIMIEAAAACVRHSSLKRPKMGQVVRALDTLASTDLTNGMKVGESGQQSSEIRVLERMAFGSQNFSSGFFRQDSSSISEGDNVNTRIE